jgi:hypothetical protein
MAYLAGADVSNFEIFSIRPHLSYANQTSGFFAPLESISGPLLPVVTAIILMLITPKTKNVFLETFKTVFTFLTAFSLLGGIIAVTWYSMGRSSNSDILSFFTQNPSVNPMLVSAACLFLITVLLVLIGKKANYLLIPGLFNLLLKDGSTVTNRKKKVILSLLVILSLGLAGSCFFTPEKSQTLLRINLSSLNSSNMELYRFDVRQDSITYKYSIEGLNASEFELYISADSTRKILFSGKDIIADIYNRSFVLHRGLQFLFVRSTNANGVFTLNQLKN